MNTHPPVADEGASHSTRVLSDPVPQWLQSGFVAKRLGVKTATLKKWRSLGKGPQVWRRVGQTVVVYLASSVAEFEHTWGITHDGSNSMNEGRIEDAN